MPKHKLRIDFDDESGEIVVYHRCTVHLAGHDVSHSEEIDLADKEETANLLRQLIDQEVDYVDEERTIKTTNRKLMEERTQKMTINHVAAVNNIPQKGVKRITLGGSLRAVGEASLKRK